MSLSDISDETVKTAIYYSNKTSLVNSNRRNESSRKTGLPPAVFTANIETIGFPVITLGQLIYIDLKPGSWMKFRILRGHLKQRVVIASTR